MGPGLRLMCAAVCSWAGSMNASRHPLEMSGCCAHTGGWAALWAMARARSRCRPVTRTPATCSWTTRWGGGGWAAEAAALLWALRERSLGLAAVDALQGPAAWYVERKLSIYNPVLQVALHTSTLQGAGTTANVWFQLHGSAGSGPPQQVAATPQAFARGSVDAWRCRCRQLGQLQRLSVWHDNSGAAPDWHLARVVVSCAEVQVGCMGNLAHGRLGRGAGRADSVTDALAAGAHPPTAVQAHTSTARLPGCPSHRLPLCTTSAVRPGLQHWQSSAHASEHPVLACLFSRRLSCFPAIAGWQLQTAQSTLALSWHPGSRGACADTGCKCTQVGRRQAARLVQGLAPARVLLGWGKQLAGASATTCSCTLTGRLLYTSACAARYTVQHRVAAVPALVVCLLAGCAAVTVQRAAALCRQRQRRWHGCGCERRAVGRRARRAPGALPAGQGRSL